MNVEMHEEERGPRILILKAPPENLDGTDPYVVSLQNAGIRAEVVHVLSFEYMNLEVLRSKVLHPNKFGGFVFTSPRSVNAVSQSMGEDDFDHATWSCLPSYVVGESTARVLEEKLGLIGVGQESGSAQNLADYILEDISSKKCKPLIFPCAEQKHHILPERLLGSGIGVDCVTCYKTVEHPDLRSNLESIFAQGGSKPVPNVLVFFSPSGVRSVLPLLRSYGVSLTCSKIMAIGPTTESAIEEQGISVQATAVKPSPESIVEAIKNLMYK